MSDEIRVTMLGYSATGKTCYLLGMHHQMQLGAQNFTLRSTDPDVDGELDEKWAVLEAGGPDRWPHGNVDRFDEYQFDLEYGLAEFMKVNWVDYRGGTIDSLYQAEDFQKLMSLVKQSSCIFLTVPGEYLADSLTYANAAKIRVPRMNDLMAQAVRHFQPSHEKPLPVAIVITKYDLCRGKRTEDQIKEDIKRLFNPLFARRHHLFLKSPSFLTAICPVTLGDDLVDDGTNGMASPRNMQLPIFFAAWAALRQRLADAARTGAESDQLAELRGKKALLQERFGKLPVYLEGADYDFKSDTQQ